MLRTGLNPEFRKLWLGQSISFLGTEITRVALPLTAVLVLDATPTQMGWLVAAEHLPMAFFGLLAGVWVDRMRRKPILVWGDLGRAALLATIPLTALLGGLTMAQLLAVAFGTGSFYVVSAVADRAYIPSLLGKAQLLAGNSRIMFSMSFALLAGPGLAGVLVEWFTAPFAIVVDVVSFVAAGLLVRSIRHDEPAPEPERERSVWPGVREGLQRVSRSPVLRPLVLCGATHNLCSTMIVSVYVLYVTRHLGLTPILLGVVLLAGGGGALLGSTISSRLSARVGVGPALVVAQLFTGFARLMVPLAGGGLAAIVAVLFASSFLLGIVRAIFNITQISLRQAVTPDAYQGRVNATVGFLFWVFAPLGALAGGYLGDTLGVRPTLWLAASGVLAATLAALPLRVRRELTSAAA